MGPLFFSLGVLLLSSIFMTINFMLPSLNLHGSLALDNQLEIAAQKILDKSRYQNFDSYRTVLISELKDLDEKFTAIDIDKVSAEKYDQYIKAEISYSYKKLFKNNFFDPNQQAKNLYLIVDNSYQEND